jgi:hypothetical protein
MTTSIQEATVTMIQQSALQWRRQRGRRATKRAMDDGEGGKSDGDGDKEGDGEDEGEGKGGESDGDGKEDGATIAVSAAIAAAFWLIVVCPHCCLCFRLPPPFLPAPAVATADVCRRHCQCPRHRHRRRPCSFRCHRCNRCLFFCHQTTVSMFQRFQLPLCFKRFRRRGRRCLCFDRHRHHSSSLQVVRR